MKDDSIGESSGIEVEDLNCLLSWPAYLDGYTHIIVKSRFALYVDRKFEVPMSIKHEL